jgi:hypothetical protein
MGKYEYIIEKKNFFFLFIFFRIDPITGRVSLKRHDDPMKDWPEERKMLEAEKLADSLERAIK